MVAIDWFGLEQYKGSVDTFFHVTSMHSSTATWNQYTGICHCQWTLA